MKGMMGVREMLVMCEGMMGVRPSKGMLMCEG